MNTDLHDRVAALRPAPAIDPDRRDAMLAAILQAQRSGSARHPWSSHRRRVVVGGSLAGLAAVAAAIVPAVLPSSGPLGHASPAAAAELRRLAVVVEHHRAVTLGPHRFLYIAEREVQRGLIGTGTNGNVYGTSITSRQGWTSRTGRLWRKDITTNPIEHRRVDVYVIAPNGDDSPQHLASLPTDVERLREYLRAQFAGTHSIDRQVFDEIESILQISIAPPALRSAALRVLATTDGVTVSRNVRDSTGRPADRFSLTYVHGELHETDSAYLDRRDAKVLETRSLDRTGVGTSHPRRTTFVDTVTAQRIVHSVPAAIRRHAHG